MTNLFSKCLLAAASALVLASTGPSFAQTTHIVTESTDSISGSLRDAVDMAASGDTITFDSALSGAVIRLTGGTLVIDEDITIDASSLSERVQISGDTNNNGPDSADVRVMEIEAGTTVTLQFLTIRDGHTPSPPQGTGPLPNRNGAGLYVFGNLTLLDCLVTENRTGDGAPGINTGTTFDESGDDGANGGGIAVVVGSLLIRDSTISNNRTGDGGPSDFGVGGRGGSGAGIYCGGSVTIENSLIQGNVTGDGGISTADAGGIGGFGGGIDHAGGVLTVTNSTIVGNMAGKSSAGTVGTTFSGGGGGINATSTFQIRNTTITGNSVPVPGNGGIHFGGGLAVSSQATPGSTLTNTILAENTVSVLSGGEGPDFGSLNNTAPAFEGVNLIGDNTDAHPWFLPGAPNADGHYVGTAFAPLDPLLSPLQDNGGTTLTRLPLTGSPAIDPTGGDITTPFPFDQRGNERLENSIVDIGAVETPAVAEPPPPVDNSSLKAALESKIKVLRKNLRFAKRSKQVLRVKKLTRQIKKLTKQLRAL